MGAYDPGLITQPREQYLEARTIWEAHAMRDGRLIWDGHCACVACNMAAALRWFIRPADYAGPRPATRPEAPTDGR